jgi:EmrB/QacA subfamily drug resistance transporter
VSPSRENPPPERLYALKWRIFGVMMIGWAMSLLDVSIVNVTIPELQKDLSTDIATVTWVINAYNIAFAVLLVTAGRLADQFGRRRLFVIGMVVFTIGSGLCATAWSVEWLIVFRVIQGMGAGMLAPLGFAMTALVFPPQQRGFGLSLIAVVALVSSATGPVLGGVLVELLNWHWIFLINLPFGVIGVVLALRWWPETWDLSAVGRKVDVLGMVLLGGAVFALTFALVEANPGAGDVALFLSLMQLAVLLAVGFYFSQRRPEAMIPQSIIRNAQFRRGNLALLLFSAGALGTLLLLALIFVNLWGYSELEGALALVPVPLCGLAVWPLVGRAADTRAPGDIAAPALAIMAVGMIWVSFLPSTADDAWAYIRILPGLVLIGIGMGIGFPSLNVGAMGAVSGQELGVASGILNTARQLGAAIGVALLVSTFGGVTAGYMSLFGNDHIDDLVDDWQIPREVTKGIVGATLHDYAGGTSDRFQAKPGFDQEVIRVTAGAAREGFAWALRHGALLVLSAIPLARSLRRTPQQARAAEVAAAGASPPLPPQSDGRDGAPRGSPAAPATG